MKRTKYCVTLSEAKYCDIVGEVLSVSIGKVHGC